MVMEEGVIIVFSNVPVLTTSCSPTAASILEMLEIQNIEGSLKVEPMMHLPSIIVYDKVGLSSDTTIRGLLTSL